MIWFRKAVLIIHGFAGGTYDQERLANYLQKNYKLDVYAFTLPGHEKRTFKSAKYTDWITSCEKQIENLIEYGYKEIYLIGHSMGGVLATYLANKYKCVKKIVLVAPAFNYFQVKEKRNMLDKFKGGMKIIRNTELDEVVTRVLKLPLSSAKEFQKFIYEYKDSYLQLHLPTLILQGDKDVVVPVESSIQVYEQLNTKKKDLIILEGITHNVFEEVPEDILYEIESFLL